MAESIKRKKQDRVKAAARRADQERRRAKAARQRQSAERYAQLSDPSASPAEIAQILVACELLARADASRDPGQWLEVIGSAAGRDHPGETCGLIEPYLGEHPDDELAGRIYALALTRAHARAEPVGLEASALDRYRDRSGVDALDRAVDEFIERTPWGEIIRTWLEGERAGQKLRILEEIGATPEVTEESRSKAVGGLRVGSDAR